MTEPRTSFAGALVRLVIRREAATPAELIELLNLFRDEYVGKNVYTPAQSREERLARNAAMRLEHLDDGAPYKVLASRYGLKIRQVRYIVDRPKAA